MSFMRSQELKLSGHIPASCRVRGGQNKSRQQPAQPVRPAIQDKSGNYTQEYEEGRARVFEELRQELLQQRGY